MRSIGTYHVTTMVVKRRWRLYDVKIVQRSQVKKTPHGHLPQCTACRTPLSHLYISPARIIQEPPALASCSPR